jgi:4,5-dihydroxyphthalate decarboxylase
MPMPDLPLTLAMAEYDKTLPLAEGLVKPAGIDLRYVVSPPSETFWRMLKFDEFDAAEMSLATYMIARARGRRWIAIPVFPFRAFFHTLVVVRAGAGIDRPGDLAGKRVGLPEYQMTAAVWMRGVLQHHFGVPPTAVKWVVERRAALSHGGQTGFTPPPGVEVAHAPDGETLGSLIAAGRLDAVMCSPFPGLRSMLNATDLLRLVRLPGVRWLFEDPVAEGVRYYRESGFSHINHTVVVQERLLERHPWVALNLYQAFVRAKEDNARRLDRLLRSSLVFAFAHLETERRLFGDDPYPYGLAANRPALETLASYMVEQGLLAEPVAVDTLFAESTRHL